ncbi:MAG: hypothetical protein ACOH1O_07540 [Flavobacterium sp.]
MTTFYKKRKLVERRNHEKQIQQELERHMKSSSDSSNELKEPLNLQISNLLKTNLSLLKFFDVSNSMMF